jgi:hypothetical protein
MHMLRDFVESLFSLLEVDDIPDRTEVLQARVESD